MNFRPNCTPQVSSTPERQAYLRQAYFFLCECEACDRPAARTITAPASRPGSDEDGNDQLAALGRDSGRAAAEASWERTEFNCCKREGYGCCPGTLLLGVPLSDDAAGGRSLPGSEPSASSSLSPGGEKKLELWCDYCGSRVPPDAVGALLAEDEKDRRLWNEAMAAVSDAEEGKEGDRHRRSRPSSGSPPRSDRDAPSSATSLALGLVVERIEWREARLCALSMKRAVAHDVHARILATQGDFAGGADACARAVHVLVKRFAPEDQELGVEFLKLAELCFNAGWIDKCNAACRKARLSLEVFLQPGDEKLVALDTLQGLCAAALSSRKG